MTTHCQLGDTQSIVTYKFGNSNQKTTVIKNAPIDVSTYQEFIGKTPNYRPGGQKIQFYSPNNRITLDIVVRDYLLFKFDQGNGTMGDGISWVNCDANDFNRNPDGSPNGPEIALNTLIRFADAPENRCPGEPKVVNASCFIEVKHNNLLISKDSGDCPINYSVTCGEECPPGTIKCLSTNYPGYCCIPCSEIKNEIKAIASQIRSLQ